MASSENPKSKIQNPKSSQGRFYPQTGYTLDPNFIPFYDSHGGVAILGYPISEARNENGYLVQWTERERLELHPEHRGTNSEVLVGLLGHELTRDRGGPAFNKAKDEGRWTIEQPSSIVLRPSSGAAYFPETRQYVSEPFHSYWRRNGGLEVFGYPISALYAGDANLQTQWFERARFEYHPELPDPYKVSLGLLGVETLHRAGEERAEIEIVDSPALEPPLQIGLSQGGESSDPGFFDNIREAGSELGNGLVRLDNIYNFYHVVGRSSDGQVTYDWRELDKVLDSVKAMGKEPFLCLSYMPETISMSGNSRVQPPANLDEWAALVGATVRHVNIERKLGVRYWEVWNEPNQWDFWKGSFEQYLQLYDVTAQAALAVDPSIQIGGPAFSNFEAMGISEFMEHEARECDKKVGKLASWKVGKFQPSNLSTFQPSNLQSCEGHVDFLSWHAYGQSPEQIAEEVRQARAITERFPQLHPELFITEFNVLQGGKGDTSANGNTDKVDGAISLLASIEAMQRERLDHALLFELKDGAGPSSYWGRWGALTYDGKPKPVYHVLKAYQNRPAGGLPIVMKRGPTDGTLGVLAYGDPSNSLIFVWYTGKKGALIDVGLPTDYANIDYSVTLFDATHNNPAKTGATTLSELAQRNAADLSLDANPDSLFILASIDR